MPEVNSLLADLLSGDETRAEAAVPGLLALGAEALSGLREAARAEDPDRRWWAVRVLAESPAASSKDLAAFLKDPAPAVRQVTALGLSTHPSEDVIPGLVEALSDPDSLVASLAGNALVKIGPAAVPALLEVLKGAPQSARILALRTLARLKDHRAIPAMLNIMREDSALLSHWAQDGLERLGLDMVYIKPT